MVKIQRFKMQMMHKNLLDFLTPNFWIKKFFSIFPEFFSFKNYPKIRNFSKFFLKKIFFENFCARKNKIGVYNPNISKKFEKIFFVYRKNFFSIFSKFVTKFLTKKSNFSKNKKIFESFNSTFEQDKKNFQKELLLGKIHCITKS